MRNRSGLAVAWLVFALAAMQGEPARAQWDFPGGFGDWGWGGWGGGATVAGDQARGLGTFAQGAGFYNKQTAIADSINVDTVMRWNDYVFESQRLANQARLRRMAQRREANTERLEDAQKRLRDQPTPRDVTQGDALNAALDEINNPRIYAKALRAATVRVGGDVIRNIPFRYNAAMITIGLHQLATDALPAPLLRPEFAKDFEAIKALDLQILAQVDENEAADPATVRKLLDAIYDAEGTAAAILPRGSLDQKQADRYLKALHGLVVMLKAPNIESLAAGADRRPDATLGELLTFMNAFNLRFGVASTPTQRVHYNALHSQLVALRDEVSPPTGVMATITSLPGSASSWIQGFFSGMSYDDLRKAAPRP
ncbi:hypothetical protein [Paludisphaera mucosa]|uniref:Uncharacterized protein n=1 Tax=Paludisphaera mucosa TaxID=3030827 RepID=A0ABT6FK40_9BACT|nr:hypothetical protein [Paludisphaera mucosa]MDG3007750.1 hypothetical protein [Paludisphaera mucosa]